MIFQTEKWRKGLDIESCLSFFVSVRNFCVVHVIWWWIAIIRLAIRVFSLVERIWWIRDGFLESNRVIPFIMPIYKYIYGNFDGSFAVQWILHQKDLNGQWCKAHSIYSQRIHGFWHVERCNWHFVFATKELADFPNLFHCTSIESLQIYHLVNWNDWHSFSRYK